MAAPDGVAILTPLFDRFESDEPATLDTLVRDLADLLGARRLYRGQLPGVLGWGLPDMIGMSPASDKDRQQIASMIARAIERFEPRLSNVRVTPVGTPVEFTFVLDANLVQWKGEGVKLRILSPHKGGALGADVTVLDG